MDRIEIIRADVRARWLGAEHLTVRPWLKRATVRVLLYAEGSIKFDGGGFLGLKHVVATLAADPWPWVRFEVTRAHRTVDPSADLQNKRLDQLDLRERYDELWLFGIAEGNLLSADEKKAVKAFMDAGGGVLSTGDHASLGYGIAGEIPRAGKMRKWPAPPAAAPGWNTTLREGPDPNGTFDFDDQSDTLPQTIRWKRYPDFTPVGVLPKRVHPHPILCGPRGPIAVLPDHQHEGEAVAPSALDPADWPSAASVKPEVIAWAKIVDPAAANAGKEFGVIAAYDGHLASVGRVASDATWHHFFDINLTGNGSGAPFRQGFPESASGQAALKDIEAYFLNLAVWLATPTKQKEMRAALAWWSIFTGALAELDKKTPIRLLGAHARDVFGRLAPRCVVRQWFLADPLPAAVRERLEGVPVPESFEEVVLGAQVAALIDAFRPDGIDPAAEEVPAPAAVAEALGAGAAAGLREALRAEARTLDEFRAVVGEHLR